MDVRSRPLYLTQEAAAFLLSTGNVKLKSSFRRSKNKFETSISMSRENNRVAEKLCFALKKSRIHRKTLDVVLAY